MKSDESRRVYRTKTSMKRMLAPLAAVAALLTVGAAHAEAPQVSLCDPVAQEGSPCGCQDPELTCVAPEAPPAQFQLCLRTDLESALRGWQIDIQGQGDVQIQEFAELFQGPIANYPPLVQHLQADPENDASSLRINWMYDDDGELWPGDIQCIGTLLLNVGPELSTLSVLASSMAVKSVEGADLEMVSIDPGKILLPEPSRSGLLVAGIALLLLLAGAGRLQGVSTLLLVLSSVAGGIAQADVVAASRTLVDADFGVATTSELGSAMAVAGDADGDGVRDLVLGLPDADSGRGQVLVTTLRRDGSVDQVWVIEQGARGFAGPLAPGDAFGSAVASPGDLNGDGVPEIAVAAPGDNAVWLLFLRRGGTTGSDLFVNFSRRLATAGPVYALAGLGDVDSDGVPDLALGHPENADVACGGGGGSCGMVTLLRLQPDGSVKDRSTFYGGDGDVPPLVAGDRFGAALAALGDLDGNGVRDLAVGMPGHDSDRGSVALLLLGFAPPAGSGGGGAEVVLLTPPPSLVLAGGLRLDGTSAGFPATLQAGDLFGSALANVGDWDGNGTSDLIVGAPGRGTGAAGAAFLLPLESAAMGGGVHGPGAVLDGSAGELPDAFGVGTEFGRSLAVLDIDGDIDVDVLVGAAGDAPALHPGLAWQLLLSDADSDGRPDSFADNCPDIFNPDQLDGDGDAVGDVCDNCAGTANGAAAGRCTGGDPLLLNSACSVDADCNGMPGTGFCSTNQEDADLDGVGDVCEGVEVRLTGPYGAELPLIPDSHWKLEMDCGAHNVTELALALFQPDLSLPLDLDFSGCVGHPFFSGPGCGDPGATPAASVGTGSGAITTDASGAFVAGGGVTLTGLRPNTLYAFLEGNLVPGGRLCNAFDQDVPLGWFGDPAVTTAIANLQVAGSQLELVGSGPGAIFTQTGVLNDFCLRDWPAPPVSRGKSVAKRFKQALPFAPIIEIAVNPALDPAIDAVGLAPVPAQAWEVCFQSDEPLNRIKLAIERPLKMEEEVAVFDREDLKWVGCGDDPGENDCTANYAVDDFLYPVSGAQSQLHVPNPLMPEDDGRGDRIYAVVSGAKRGFDSEYVRLNTLTNGPPYQEFWHCLGQVRVTGGSDATNETPNVHVLAENYLGTGDQGIGISSQFCIDQNNQLGCDDPANSFNTPDEVYINYNCGNLADADGDGVRIEADNCPYFHNPLQRDNGSLKAAAPEGRDNVGDACQCGEGDGDGIVSELGDGPGDWTGEDLENLRQHLVGNTPPDFEEARCNLANTDAQAIVCDILDAVKLQQALLLPALPEPTSLPGLCAAYDPPGSDL